MATIIVNTPFALPSAPLDYLLINPDKPFKELCLNDLLLILGMKLTKDEEYTKWFKMSKIATMLRNYRLSYPGSIHAKDLNEQMIQHAKNNDTIHGYFNDQVYGVWAHYLTEDNKERRKTEVKIQFRRVLYSHPYAEAQFAKPDEPG
jgi:hypothetical protein